MQKRSLSYTS